MLSFEWRSRLGLLGSRGFLALVGLARTILVLRILTLEDYSTLAVAESFRMLVTAAAGLGIAEAVAREGPARADAEVRDIIAVGLAATVVLAIAGSLVTVIAGWLVDELGHAAAGLSSALMIAAGVVLAERFWGFLHASLVASQQVTAYVAAMVINGVVVAVITVWWTARWGVAGYFAAQAIVMTLGAIGLILLLVRRLGVPPLTAFGQRSKDVLRRLWPIAWFSYVMKCSLISWRRLPIVIGGSLLSPIHVGIVAAALDLSSKLQLAHEAIGPIVTARLSRIWRLQPGLFGRFARIDLIQLTALYMVVATIGILLWIWVGPAIIGQERWQQIGTAFYLALAVEFTLLAAQLLATVVIVPAGAVVGLSVRTLWLRLAVIPVLTFHVAMGIEDTLAIFLAMAISGIAVAITYANRSATVLRDLGS